MFDAPGRFSTMNGCFSDSANLSASMRAMMSVPPPAFAPTMMRERLVRIVGLGMRGQRGGQQRSQRRA